MIFTCYFRHDTDTESQPPVTRPHRQGDLDALLAPPRRRCRIGMLFRCSATTSPVHPPHLCTSLIQSGASSMADIHFGSEAPLRSEFYPPHPRTTPTTTNLSTSRDTLQCPNTSLHTFSHSTRLPLAQCWGDYFHFHILPQDCRACPARAAAAPHCHWPLTCLFVCLAKYPLYRWKAHRLFHFPDSGRLVTVIPCHGSVLRLFEL